MHIAFYCSKWNWHLHYVAVVELHEKWAALRWRSFDTGSESLVQNTSYTFSNNPE